MAGPGLTVPLGVLLLLLAVWAAITARGGWIGALRRDGRLGARTPAASTSDDAFALANRVAAPVLAGAAGAALLTGVIVLAVPLSVAAVLVVVLLGLVGSVVLAVAGATLGERAARTLPLPARAPGSSAACDGCGCGAGGCAALTRRDTAAAG